MPTTKWKNSLYLLALPLMAPRLERNPQIRVEGHPLAAPDSWLRLLRKNHVRYLTHNFHIKLSCNLQGIPCHNV